MFCPRCGKAHPDHVRVCTQCGEEIVNRAAQSNPEYDATVMASPYDNAAYQPPVQSENYAPYNQDDFDKTMAARPQQGYENYQQPYDYAPVQEYQPEEIYNQGYNNMNLDPDYGAGSYYPQSNPYEEEQEKKTFSSASIIIAVCAVALVVLIAAAVAVIHSQYGGFEDFISSFSDSDRDRDREDDDDEDEDDERVTAPSTTRRPQNNNAHVATAPATTVASPTTAPQRRADGNCGINVQYTFNSSTGELVIFGSGEMFDYSEISTPWKNKNVSRVIIEEGVTKVTSGSLASQTIDYIYVPSTVRDFSLYAVDYFAEIEVSPSNGYYISRDGALLNKDGTMLICYPNESSATSYTIPYGVIWIGPYAFFNADNLTNVTIPATVQYIDAYAFKGCENIRNLHIPATVLEIDTGVFSGWGSDQSVYFETGEVLVSDNWNEDCNADITIAD